MTKRLILPIFFGMVAGILLLVFYLAVMGFSSGSLAYSLNELERLRFWVTFLIVGFGLQVGLFTYLKQCNSTIGADAGSVAGGTASSSLAMVACCAHHLVEILPLLGIGAAATFLSAYQEWFLAVAVIVNFAGVIFMAKRLRRLRLKNEE